MGPWLISLFASVGATTWVYNHFQRTSGNNTQRSAMAAGFAGLVLFILLGLILSTVLKNNG